MSFEILIDGSMEFDELLGNDRKQNLSLSPSLWCTQTEDLLLLATSV